MEEDTAYTLWYELSHPDTRSWIEIRHGEFRAYFADLIDNTVDVRIYRVESDSTDYETHTL